MSQAVPLSLRIVMLVAGTLLAACSSSTAMGPGPRRAYAQSMDSATSACLRNPACYTQVGDDAVLPWLSRAASAARTVAATLRLLEAAEIQRVEFILVECAKLANFEVNERVFGEGKRPTREQCEKVVRRDSKDKPVTWAMDLGTAKHAVALKCAEKRLKEMIPGNFSVEPRYFRDPRTGRLRLLDPEDVKLWLQEGLFHLLLGTLVPDVVLHASGDPLKVQTAYDFEFPCASSKEPEWERYPQDHPHQGRTQGDVYHEDLQMAVEPARVSPGYGISR
ncbi:hypothetical protein [Myxococcus sp. RHSTA-1-4]|uniref:hypothetical protein n=1 Tax=Myxococcus sp. RHSTA-1-4 TaxID=2874601 RepID=UPI001CBD2F35|nr:hypothetical protein [Myxococcus sp. RHSTA-1-4]MBZ4419558.1 hypothetical protein [Myxococcus sp. RHSTA-1-4]